MCAGKTSLFRVLAGLWPAAAGKLACPKSGILMLPQSPYLVSGTLRDQVTYPALAGFQRRFDARVEECLRAAGLGTLLDTPAGLDLSHEEWDGVLSGGERQRCASASVHRCPVLVVTD